MLLHDFVIYGSSVEWNCFVSSQLNNPLVLFHGGSQLLNRFRSSVYLYDLWRDTFVRPCAHTESLELVALQGKMADVEEATEEQNFHEENDVEEQMDVDQEPELDK